MPENERGVGAACDEARHQDRSIAPSATRRSPIPRKQRWEFVNTWSVDGFIGEGSQPCELGWGIAREAFSRATASTTSTAARRAIYLTRPGASVRVRSWTPSEGQYHGFLITHGESISISDYFTVRKNGKSVVYRPTCHYAYHPCDDTVLSVHELAGRNWVGAGTTSAS